MTSKLNGKIKRGLLAAAASGAAVVASLAVLPASPALAYTEQCTTHSGSVTFKVCTLQLSTTSARARVSVSSGTYISGSLYLLTPGNLAKEGCAGRHNPGGSCSFSSAQGKGVYRAQWISVSNGVYNGPAVIVQ